MGKFFKSKFFIVLLIVSVIVVALMILSTAGGSKSNFASDGIGIVATPVKNAFYAIGSWTDNAFSGVIKAGQYKALYGEAQKEITRLENENVELDTLRAENERLRQLLAFRDSSPYNTVAGQVSAKNAGNMYSDFKVNRGTNDGVKKDDVVITDKGLVGYVSQVGTTWCNVRTILDDSSSVGCIVGRTGDRAIIDGGVEYMDDEVCAMSYLAKNSSVAVGDNVSTSGIGSIYPEGILIGQITEITPDLQGLYNKATVKPSVDFESVREVLIIIK